MGNQVAVVASPTASVDHGSSARICPQCGQLIDNYFEYLDQFNRVTSVPPSRESTPGQSPMEKEISELSMSQGYFDHFFKELGLLGRGSRAAVYKVEHILEGVSIGVYALKKIPIGYNHDWLNKVLTEVNLLRSLSHKNLVHYNHVWLEVSSLSKFGPPVPCAYMLQEYCDGGNLEDYVFERENTDQKYLSYTEIVSMMTDICSGMDYLHSKGFVHCDLKPSNCLLKSRGDSIPEVLVSDFGESQFEGSRRVGTGTTGTLEYCAPEVLNKDVAFSYSSDMYSVGMTLHFLCFSKLPYSNAWEEEGDLHKLRTEIQGFTFDYDTSNKIGRTDLDILEPLLNRLLGPPSDRPNAEETLHALRPRKRKRREDHTRTKKVQRLEWDTANNLRLLKLTSVYLLTPSAATLKILAAISACELIFGYPRAFFYAHFGILIIGLYFKL